LPDRARPVVGVGGVLVRDGRVLLIRRGKEPLRGRWLIPGGSVEWGETLEQAVVREMEEETGLQVRPTEVLAVVDRIEPGDPAPYHYVIVDFLCEYVSGRERAGSDADELAFVAPGELPAFDLPEKALAVVAEAFERLAPRGDGADLPGRRPLR
jgi:ADP-ribose pyrophosphatase YjhB (NUDIX family)